MHLNDIIINILRQFHANSVNTIISMQTKHETLLFISIIDSFCAQLKLFCETVILSEYFWTGTENTTLGLFHENCNVLENMRIYPKCVMYLIALFFHKSNIFRRKPFIDAFNKI